MMRPSLLEREFELRNIQQRFDAAQDGTGSVLILAGPPGIGKTSVIAEAKNLAVIRGFSVLNSRGIQFEQGIGFDIVHQLFDPMLRAQDRSLTFRGIAKNAASYLEDEGSAIGFTTLHALYWAIVNLCEKSPVLITLDDMHWADEQSMMFVEYLRTRISELPVFILAGIRPNEIRSRITAGIIGDSSSDVSVVTLNDLSRSAAREMLLSATTESSFSEDFFTTCHAATKGNPLLLSKISSIIEDGVAVSAGGRWDAISDAASQVVSWSVFSRLSRFPKNRETLARSIAVLGGNVDSNLAIRHSDLDPIEGLECIADLMLANIIEVSSQKRIKIGADSIISFSHPLVGEALYKSIPAASLAEQHKFAAKILDSLGASIEQVALHLAKTPPSGDRGASSKLRRAGAAACARGMIDLGYELFRRALIEPAPDDIRTDLLMDAGLAARMVDGEESIRFFAQAAVEYSEFSKPLQAEALALQGSALHFIERTQEGIDVWFKALDVARECDAKLKRKIEAALVGGSFFTARREDLVSLTDDLLKKDIEDDEEGNTLECILAWRQAYSGDREAVARARRGLALAPLDDKIGAMCPVGAWWTLIHSDHPEVLPELETLEKSVREQGSLAAVAVIGMLKADAHLRDGSLKDAETEAKASLDLARAVGMARACPFIGAYLAEALIEQGCLDEAAEVLHRSSPTDPCKESFAVVSHRHIAAYLEKSKGNYREAFQKFLENGENFQSIGGRNPALCPWMSEAALCARLIGGQEDAEELALQELAFARSWGAPRALGRSLRAAGTVLGGEKGLQYLRESVDVLESAPGLELSKSFIELGRALRQSGSRKEAREYLARGIGYAERCGAESLVQRGKDEFRTAGGRIRRTSLFGIESLTASERRVAEMATHGMSNSDIGQELFVTIKTVEVHLGNAYRKLGIKSRKQLPEYFA